MVCLWVKLVVKCNRNVLMFHGDNESGRSRLGRVGAAEVQTRSGRTVGLSASHPSFFNGCIKGILAISNKFIIVFKMLSRLFCYFIILFYLEKDILSLE